MWKVFKVLAVFWDGLTQSVDGVSCQPNARLLSSIFHYIPRRKSGIYWIQVRRAAAAAVEISLWTR